MEDPVLQRKVEEWLKWSKNETDNKEIQALVDEGNADELQLRLFHRMEFGTAGLRARMGAGYNMMNDLTVIQATQSYKLHSHTSYTGKATRMISLSYKLHRYGQLNDLMVIQATQSYKLHWLGHLNDLTVIQATQSYKLHRYGQLNDLTVIQVTQVRPPE
ncbi:hypothetical protein DPMN_117407 [Dreissena polymorpha]|uniref:Uncharacterized protein n=1 Tax=Dreissena polymorpha TaxID=45954 RepID=A0A9D4KQV2_DREPO|nr:hypothetical protein DPMN_117407 [Dreissena polymorpha]